MRIGNATASTCGAYRIGRIDAVAACPNIAAPVDLIDSGFDVLIVSEVADTVLDRELRLCALAPAEVGELERALTRALEVLHGEGLVYCDVREDNVLRFGDTWTLADLGGVVEHYAPIEAIQKEAAYRRHGAVASTRERRTRPDRRSDRRGPACIREAV
jgi:hypothetical protein